MSTEAFEPEPFDALLLLLKDAREREAEVRDAIQQAVLMTFVDMDRLTWAARVIGGPPTLTSSMRAARIEFDGRSFTARPDAFTYLARKVFEDEEPMGLPRTTVCELCRLVGDRIDSVPLRYTFASALAYALELAGDREAALRVWEEHREVVPLEWVHREFERPFLELHQDRPERDMTDVEKATAGAFRRLLETANVRREDVYWAWRMLGLVYWSAGQVDDALGHLRRALELAGEAPPSAGRLILLGDIAWVSHFGGRPEDAQQAASDLSAELDRAEAYVGHAAVFARSATVCGIVGNELAEWRFVARLPACLS